MLLSACPDSNRDYTVFETVASTCWATSGGFFDCVSYSIIGLVSLSIWEGVVADWTFDGSGYETTAGGYQLRVVAVFGGLWQGQAWYGSGVAHVTPYCGVPAEAKRLIALWAARNSGRAAVELDESEDIESDPTVHTASRRVFMEQVKPHDVGAYRVSSESSLPLWVEDGCFPVYGMIAGSDGIVTGLLTTDDDTVLQAESFDTLEDAQAWLESVPAPLDAWMLLADDDGMVLYVRPFDGKWLSVGWNVSGSWLWAVSDSPWALFWNSETLMQGSGVDLADCLEQVTDAVYDEGESAAWYSLDPCVFLDDGQGVGWAIISQGSDGWCWVVTSDPEGVDMDAPLSLSDNLSYGSIEEAEDALTSFLSSNECREALSMQGFADAFTRPVGDDAWTL